MGQTARFEIKNVKLNDKDHEQEDKVLTCRYVLENVHVVATQQHNSDFWKGATKDVFGDAVGENSKFMFAHQSLRRVLLNPALTHTILLCQQGYTEKQKKVLIDRFLELKCNVWQIDSAQHVVNYINTKDPNDDGSLKAVRLIEKVERLLIYSHGIVSKICLGMGQFSEGDDKLKFDKDIAKKLNPLAFAVGAKVYSFACRTGLGNPEINKSIYKTQIRRSTPIGVTSMGVPISQDEYGTIQMPLYSAQSLAQAIANSGKVTTLAYLCRSDYEDTLNTPDELDFMDAYRAGVYKETRERKNYDTLANYGEPTDIEIERYKILNDRFKSRVIVDKMRFDPQGALHPVKGGTTPVGLPQDMKTYKPL